MAYEKVVEAVTKELNKIVPPALAALQQDPLLVVEAADLVDACRIASIARDRVSLTAETTAGQSLLAACRAANIDPCPSSAVDEFLQAVLSLTLAQLPVLAAQKPSLEIALALLRLLSYRSTQERKLEKKLGPASFETVVACHLAFRAALGYEGMLVSCTVSRMQVVTTHYPLAAEDTLDAVLAQSASSASADEYGAALSVIADVLAASSMVSLSADENALARVQHALAAAQLLLLNAPEGEFTHALSCQTCESH